MNGTNVTSGPWAWPEQPFPAVRWLSAPVTVLLLRLPLSANAITTLSAACGVAAGILAMGASRSAWTASGILMILCYVLDNCDGEVARAKRQTSEFGRHYDTAVDWLVHGFFFLALGLGWSNALGVAWPAWTGAFAAAGATMNYALGLLLDRLDRRDNGAPGGALEGPAAHPRGSLEWTLFAFRELFRADFCFLVLLLGVTNTLWLLLPAAALGAQLYWMGQFSRAARRFHV